VCARANFTGVSFLADDEDLSFNVLEDLEGVSQAKAQRQVADKVVVGTNPLLGCKLLCSRTSASWARAFEPIFSAKMLQRTFIVGNNGHVRDLDFLSFLNFFDSVEF
jgi:hypothetical protein